MKNATSSYNLSALVGADRFSFFAFDQEQLKVQFLKSYDFQIKKEEELKANIHKVYSQDLLLKAAFNQSSIAITNHKSTLIPGRFFDKMALEIYLEKMITLTTNDVILVDDIPELDLKNVFVIDKGLKNILDGYFPNARYLHHSTVFIKGVRELSKHRNGYQLYLNVLGTDFQLVLFEDQDLLFSNTYEFQSANDFIYFIMLVFDQFKIKPEAVPVYLSGHLVEDSEIYKLIYRYIRHLHFIQLPNFLNYGQRLKNQTSHEYFNLYSSKLCV